MNEDSKHLPVSPFRPMAESDIAFTVLHTNRQSGSDFYFSSPCQGIDSFGEIQILSLKNLQI